MSGPYQPLFGQIMAIRHQIYEWVGLRTDQCGVLEQVVPSGLSHQIIGVLEFRVESNRRVPNGVTAGHI